MVRLLEGRSIRAKLGIQAGTAGRSKSRDQRLIPALNPCRVEKSNHDPGDFESATCAEGLP